MGFDDDTSLWPTTKTGHHSTDPIMIPTPAANATGFFDFLPYGDWLWIPWLAGFLGAVGIRQFENSFESSFVFV